MYKVSSGTVARTIALALALINQVFAITGKGTIDIADDTIYQICSLGATIVTSLTAWWKNNSFRQEALEADDTLKAAKAERRRRKKENKNVISKDKTGIS